MKLYIREIREKLEISINELARRAGVSAGYISELENGIKSNVGIDTLCKITKALGVEVKDLFDCEGGEQHGKGYEDESND